jgi:hypothetical protein
MGTYSLKVRQLVARVIGVLLLAIICTIAGSTTGCRMIGYGEVKPDASRRLIVGDIRQTGPLRVRAIEPEEVEIAVGVPTAPTPQLAEIPDQITVGVAYQTISRFTGPFSPAEFEEIQIFLAASAGTWYYNEFFNRVDADIYRKYYWPAGLGDPSNTADANRFPSTPPPENPATPGTNPQRAGAGTGPPPAANGADGILLTLKSAHYSRRYGGSVLLVFGMEEEHAYEFRFDRYLYDMPELEMLVYVVPIAYLLNPTPMPPPNYRRLIGPLAVAISVEFSLPEDYESYELVCEDATGVLVPPEQPCPANGTSLGISPVPVYRQTEARNYLAENLQSYSGDLAANMRLHASCFGYGFLHSLHAATLTSEAVRPDRIAISDDHFELVTHNGEPVFSIMYRVTDFDTWSGVIWAKPEIDGQVLSVTETEGSDLSLEREVHSFLARPGKIEVENGDDDTPWTTAGSFSYWDVQSYVENLRNLDSRVGPDDVVTVWYRVPYEVRVKMKWHTLVSTTSGTYALWAYGWPFFEFGEEFRVLSDQPGPTSIQDLIERGSAGVLTEKSYHMWDEQPPEHNLEMTLLFRVTLSFR